MIYKSAAGHKEENASTPRSSNGTWALALAGLATSIDALAVGVGLAFIDVSIGVVALVIGLCPFTTVSIGVMAGHALGALIGRREVAAGGVDLAWTRLRLNSRT